MGKQVFAANGTFTPIAGVTTYNFIVIGGGGGGAGSNVGGYGGNGAVVKATYTNVTNKLNIKIGGGGAKGVDNGSMPSGNGGGGGLTQVFNDTVNIIAGGGGGGSVGGNSKSSLGNGSDGGAPGNIDDREGQADGTGGKGVFAGDGGNFNPTGNGGAGGLPKDSDGGCGGGGSGINGITGKGASIAGYAAGGSNGGASANEVAGGGGAGFGGGSGGASAQLSPAGTTGGFGGSSTALENGVIITGPRVVYAVAPYNGLLYGRMGLGGSQEQTDITSGKAGYVEITWSEVISNICFPAGTPIETDQGLLAIEDIKPEIHTLNNERIVCVTKTITLDKYLICFKKNALGKNMPSQDTIMSKDHQVLHKGMLAPAHKFVPITNDIFKVKYSGEPLYNVLLDNYSTMKVNNLICETLHPNNTIAKLYMNSLAKTPKSKGL
jgi:hypothetical protein